MEHEFKKPNIINLEYIRNLNNIILSKNNSNIKINTIKNKEQQDKIEIIKTPGDDILWL